jgi:large subunit ribosomal protein L13
MSTEVARLLRGKHKPSFAPHLDTGDHVIVVNADKVVLT